MFSFNKNKNKKKISTSKKSYLTFDENKHASSTKHKVRIDVDQKSSSSSSSLSFTSSSSSTSSNDYYSQLHQQAIYEEELATINLQLHEQNQNQNQNQTNHDQSLDIIQYKVLIKKRQELIQKIEQLKKQRLEDDEKKALEFLQDIHHQVEQRHEQKKKQEIDITSCHQEPSMYVYPNFNKKITNHKIDPRIQLERDFKQNSRAYLKALAVSKARILPNIMKHGLFASSSSSSDLTMTSLVGRNDLSMYQWLQQPRHISLDHCDSCKVNRVINQETARSTCPVCGDCKPIASYLFDIKEIDKDEIEVKPVHVKQELNQYEYTTPDPPIELLERLSILYHRIPFVDRCKVTIPNMKEMLKSVKDLHLSSTMKRSSYRLSKILKNESLVGFSSSEINELLLQRALLKKQPRKSINNNAFLSQFGRANGFEQARLIKNHKTFKSHRKVIHALESSIEPHIDVFKRMTQHSTCSLKPWQLMPST